MSHQGREWERINWEQSRPGDSKDPLARRLGHRLLNRPLRTMLILITGSIVFLTGSYAIFGYGDPALSAEHAAVAGTLEVDGTICCSAYREIDGQEYVFLIVLDNPGFFSTSSRDVSLRVARLEPDGTPEEVASLDAPIDSVLPLSLALVADTLYVPVGVSDDDDHGLWMIDVGNPESPEEAGLHTADRYYRNVAAVNDELLIAHSSREFVVYDASNPPDLVPVGNRERPQPDASQLQMVEGMLAFHANLAGSIFLWDFSEPGEPEPLGRHVDRAYAERQEELGRRQIASAEDFLNLRVPPDRFHDFVVSGDYMYVASGADGLEIVDVSDPAEPDILGSVQLTGRAVRTTIAGDHLFVMTAKEHSTERLAYEVHRFDLSNPANPEPAGVVDDIRAVPGRQGIETGGGYLFLGLNDTLLVLDPAD